MSTLSRSNADEIVVCIQHCTAKQRVQFTVTSASATYRLWLPQQAHGPNHLVALQAQSMDSKQVKRAAETIAAKKQAYACEVRL